MSVLRKLSKVVGHDDRRNSGDLSPSGSASPHSANRRSLAQILHFEKGEVSGTETETDSDLDDDGMSKNAARRHAQKEKKKAIRSRLSLESGDREDSEERARQRLEEAKSKETDEMRARYGDLPLMQSQGKTTGERIHIDTITEDMVGKEVVFRARVHHLRNMGQKLMFLIFRQQIHLIQGVLVEEFGKIGPLMIHWAEHLRTGNIMLVKGVIQKPETPIRAATIHGVEVKITNLHIIQRRAEPSMS